MKTKTTQEARAQLLNMAAGGNGHTDAYIERVTLDCEDGSQRTGYAFCIPAKTGFDGRRCDAQQYIGTLELCRNMYLLYYYEDLPKPDAETIPIEDYGRHITYSSPRL